MHDLEMSAPVALCAVLFPLLGRDGEVESRIWTTAGRQELKSVSLGGA